MKQYEKKMIAGVDVGDLVEARQNGCNMPPVEGIVVRNDADICVIDTCNSAQVYESLDGLRARPREVPLCAYIFGDLNPTTTSKGVTVTKL